MKSHPDIIILDYSLSTDNNDSLDGLEFLKILKERNVHVPIVVFSSSENKQNAVEMLQQGAVDYVSKNEDNFIHELLESVTQIVKIVGQKRKKEKLQSLVRRNLSRYILIAAVFILALLTIRFSLS